MKMEEYQANLLRVWAAANALKNVPLSEMLEMMGRADAVGPLLDPTLWSQKHSAMNEDRRVVMAAQELQRAVQTLERERGS